MGWLGSFFNTPARQALGWTLLGIVGIAMAAGGVWFLTSGGDGAEAEAEADVQPTATQTATATRTATATQSATPSPTPTETATPVATSVVATGSGTGAGSGSGTGTGTGGSNEQPAAQERTPTPEPAAPGGAAGGPYCPPTNASGAPPNSVIGNFTIGGVLAPAGSSVSLAFDGVIGPTRLTAEAGGYRVDYYAAPDGCANRVGASIAVVYNGQFFPTGQVVGGSSGVPVNFRVDVP